MNEKQNDIWSLGEDISAKDNNVRMIGVNSEWVILVNHIQFAVGEKPCTTKNNRQLRNDLKNQEIWKRRNRL